MSRRRPRRRRWLRALLLALVAALGLGLAATALPVLALRQLAPPTTAFMLWSRIDDPAAHVPCEQVLYTWVDWSEISPHLPLAVVVAEDQRFFQHGGFDWKSIQRALRDVESSGRLRGASTLTQQLAKNLFLWPGRSVVRKGLEAWFTLWIEALWSKRRILETYVNVAQFGPCVFGAEAASRHFFELSAAALEPEQAALLAAVLPNPKRLRAHAPGPYAQERTQEVLGLMREVGDIRHLGRI